MNLVCINPRDSVRSGNPETASIPGLAALRLLESFVRKLLLHLFSPVVPFKMEEATGTLGRFGEGCVSLSGMEEAETRVLGLCSSPWLSAGFPPVGQGQALEDLQCGESVRGFACNLSVLGNLSRALGGLSVLL